MPSNETVRQMLTPGTCLDPGRVLEVVALVESRAGKLNQLIRCLFDENPAVASRAADALERITRDRPERAQQWKHALIGLLSETTEKKVRWNLALTIPRLKLTIADCRRTAAVLETWLDDPSSIVKTSALHGMADPARTVVPFRISSTCSALPAAPALRQCARAAVSCSKLWSPAVKSRPAELLCTCLTDTLLTTHPAREDCIKAAWFSFFHPSCQQISRDWRMK